jgi:hypothetical protein
MKLHVKPLLVSNQSGTAGAETWKISFGFSHRLGLIDVFPIISTTLGDDSTVWKIQFLQKVLDKPTGTPSCSTHISNANKMTCSKRQ